MCLRTVKQYESIGRKSFRPACAPNLLRLPFALEADVLVSSLDVSKVSNVCKARCLVNVQVCYLVWLSLGCPKRVPDLAFMCGGNPQDPQALEMERIALRFVVSKGEPVGSLGRGRSRLYELLNSFSSSYGS